MKIKNHRDFWSALLFIAAGLAFAIAASNQSLGSSARPGPGFFPLVLSLSMVLLGCIVMFKALTFETDDGGPIGLIAWRALVVVVAAVVSAAFLLPWLGMLLTVPALVGMLGLAGGGFSVRRWIGTSLLVTTGCWLVFVAALRLPLPLRPLLFG